MLLIIGNKNLSSWSLRPWLLMKHFEIPFEEKKILLDQATTRTEILKYSPSARVPVLIDDVEAIWDSLAIAEYLNEKFPQKHLWPKSTKARARARCVSAEMHSGFQTLRTHMPHNLQKCAKGFDWTPAKEDIERIFDIWRESFEDFGGPFLFGDFSIADAMYAPVVNRFYTYNVPLEGALQSYVDRIRGLPEHQLWIAEALKE